jgi:ATP-dependent DNA helicase RecG
LAAPLKELGIRLNPRLLATLYKKGVRKVGDVLFLLPRAYEDRRKLARISELIPGERGVTVGTVRSAGEVRFRAGRRAFRAVLADETGSLSLTFFQMGPWLHAKFPLGKKLIISGELRAAPTGREMAHPEVEPMDDEKASLHFGRIVPIYPGFERHEQRQFRDLAFKVATGYARYLEEPLPQKLRDELGLVGLSEALLQLHLPDKAEALEALNDRQSPAHRRLAFDELFFLHLGLQVRRQGRKSEPGIRFHVTQDGLREAKATLPFTLTGAQARAVAEVASDMASTKPMMRLLQGDVGSGKTAVAVVASELARADGYQVAVMAPTEILAQQHHQTFRRLLEPRGVGVGLVTAAGTAKDRHKVRESLARGELTVAVGTHALLEGSAEFKRLGLVIIDEQHRFGVLQRHTLMSKGTRPDVLVMTATPIPRTLAMTLYGDLDVSVIDELPPGRTPITTRVFHEKQRRRVYEAVAGQLALGRQCYVVYPLVEESEKVDLLDATKGREQLQATFPKAKVGLIHGRMKNDEKEAVMAAFRAGEVGVLVATSVVEVGVDVPNASVMVVEHAERFGLSQLHQLRGRVGRGAAESFCYLVAAFARSEVAAERLAVMERSADGFVIAEKDLELRGPGELLGTRQSGLPELAVANLVRDQRLSERAKDVARGLLARDPGLTRPEHAGLVRALEERWEGRLALARVG